MLRKILPFLVLLGVPVAHAQAAPALTFTLATSTGADKASVIPTLTWSTTPAATSCTASGASNWTGTKAVAGTITLPAVSASVTYTLLCNWPGVTKATLVWVPPTTNTDGSALTDLAGYRIQWGASAANLDQSFYLQNATATGWVSPDLAAGTWFFGVRAYNVLGLEGPLSNIGSKVATAAVSDTRALNIGIRFPAPPVLN